MVSGFLAPDGRLQRIVQPGADMADTVTRYRLVARADASVLAEIFPGATALYGEGDFDVNVTDLATLNRGLGELIARGGMIVSVSPAHSSLEEQFRQAVGDGE